MYSILLNAQECKATGVTLHVCATVTMPIPLQPW